MSSRTILFVEQPLASTKFVNKYIDLEGMAPMEDFFQLWRMASAYGQGFILPTSKNYMIQRKIYKTQARQVHYPNE